MKRDLADELLEAHKYFSQKLKTDAPVLTPVTDAAAIMTQAYAQLRLSEVLRFKAMT